MSEPSDWKARARAELAPVLRLCPGAELSWRLWPEAARLEHDRFVALELCREGGASWFDHPAPRRREGLIYSCWREAVDDVLEDLARLDECPVRLTFEEYQRDPERWFDLSTREGVHVSVEDAQGVRLFGMELVRPEEG